MWVEIAAGLWVVMMVVLFRGGISNLKGGAKK